MRPKGNTRHALFKVFDGAGDQALTWKAMAARAQVGFAAAKHTARNMERAGELAVVGTKCEPGVNRPMRLYKPASGGDGRPAPGLALQRAWSATG